MASANITIETCVEDALLCGKRGEALFASVMARTSRSGVSVEWSKPPISNPFWYEGFAKDPNGKKLSRKQTRAAINRHFIESWETEILKRWDDQSQQPEVFADTEKGSYVPFGTLTALDEEKGWDVTLAGKMRRTPVEKLLRDLTPILISASRRVRWAFALENAYQDDLMQEARIRIAEKLPSYEGRAEFTTWAFRVAWHAMVDEARRVSMLRKKESLGLGLDEDAGLDEFVAIDDRLVLRPVFHDALMIVPDGRLIVLQMLGYTDAEISDANLRMRRSRARTKLTARLCTHPEVEPFIRGDADLLHSDLADVLSTRKVLSGCP
jgi:DNA-directed RNA polymerase specialized sigma24 family protein